MQQARRPSRLGQPSTTEPSATERPPTEAPTTTTTLAGGHDPPGGTGACGPRPGPFPPRPNRYARALVIAPARRRRRSTRRSCSAEGGYLLLFGIIFAESGLLIGFFLPGDSLLFIAGMAAAGTLGKDWSQLNIWVVLIGVFIAAVAGDQVGYVFGSKAGPSLFKRPDSRFFKHENVEKAQAFFDRHGPKAIVLARFVPIVRTFVPDRGRCGPHAVQDLRASTTSSAGSCGRVGVTSLGYFLGNIAFIKDNLEIAILLIVALSLMPIAIEFIRHRRSARQSAEA